MSMKMIVVAALTGIVLYLALGFRQPELTTQPNPYGLSQWELDHQGDPAVRQRVEQLKATAEGR